MQRPRVFSSRRTPSRESLTSPSNTEARGGDKANTVGQMRERELTAA
jgi:hypothetical protein